MGEEKGVGLVMIFKHKSPALKRGNTESPCGETPQNHQPE